jgi:hypothetical protein
MKKFVLPLIMFTLGLSIIFFACSKEKNNGGSGTTTMRVNLTDAPAAYDSVNVDIEQVRVLFRGQDSSTGWMDLNTNAGIYNLLGLQNGVDTLLAAGTVPVDTLKEIRLVLGTDNSIVVGGINYPLTIPSGSESGLKIKVNKKLNANLDSLLIDFDAALSIHQTGNGTYILRPVLRIQ